MRALSIRKLEKSLGEMMSRHAAKFPSESPGTVWKHYENKKLRGIQIYRDVLSNTTPVVIWISRPRRPSLFSGPSITVVTRFGQGGGSESYSDITSDTLIELEKKLEILLQK